MLAEDAIKAAVKDYKAKRASATAGTVAAWENLPLHDFLHFLNDDERKPIF
jgi:hypothetical protein